MNPIYLVDQNQNYMINRDPLTTQNFYRLYDLIGQRVSTDGFLS
jgi:hypothetical protein